MSEAGTLLSDLDNAKPTDRDLVDSILSDLNQPSGNNPVVSNGRVPIQTAPPMPSTYPNAADPAVPTAHMIGRDHPTEADFQRMMMAAQGPLPFNAMAPQMQQTIQPPSVPPPGMELKIWIFCFPGFSSFVALNIKNSTRAIPARRRNPRLGVKHRIPGGQIPAETFLGIFSYSLS